MAQRMANLVAGRRLLQSSCLYQRRWASGGVLERLKSLIGIEKENNTDVLCDIPEARGLYLHSNVPLRMKKLTSQIFPSALTEDWTEISTTDLGTKFKILKECRKEFGSVPPNNKLNECKSVKDFVTYYETLQRPGVIPEMWKLENDDLPINLSFQSPLPYKTVKTTQRRKKYY
ncbi:uncharacterized protein LOC135683104 [Rhopilema esculentum]|uniref:uncharacterized protein LOC135683104 n=1 Tax=Rhopilema esculentum TaxID=499914 RepID=UPI0031E42B57